MGGCRNPAGVEGSGGQGCGARGRRQGQAKYMHTKYRPIGGRRGACRAWPGFETTRRAEGSRRGRRAGGQAPRRSEIRRPGPKAPGTPAEHTKYRPMGGCRNPAGVKGAGGQGCGARGWRQGLAGLRDDAPSRRLAARTASGRAAAHGHPKQRGERTASTLRRRRVLGVPCS